MSKTIENLQMIKSVNTRIVEYIDRKLYPCYETDWDNELLREEVLQHIGQGCTFLEAGAGRGNKSHANFKDLVQTAVGVDIEDSVFENPYLHEKYVGSIDKMPFLESNRFDVVISNNVLEHVQEPDGFFAELNRVMKPGAVLITKTPNFHHYMPIIASITPTWFHKFYNRLRGTSETDIFPTKYLINTKKDQYLFAQKHGFKITNIKFIEGRPEYLRISFFTYLAGFIYERFVNIFGLDGIKILIITVFTKTSSTD